MTRLVDESKWEYPLFNPPDEIKNQLVQDSIFLLRVRLDTFYAMDVIEENPYTNFPVLEFRSKEDALHHLY